MRLIEPADPARFRAGVLDPCSGESLSEDDPRLFYAVQAYLAELESGRRPNRREWLTRHPDIADQLADYLDGLAFVHSAAGHMAAAPEGGADAGDFSSPGVEAELLAGQPLGDFRLLREIGRGGMGVVYEAEQLSLGRRVAVKVLPLASALDGRHLVRFKNEAHAAAQLHHTNIVPIYAVGCERTVHFYAMQLIDGRSLADVIRELRHGSTAPAASPDHSSAARAANASAVTAQALSSFRASGGGGYYKAVARLGFQAADALDYAHQFGVVHRDVKPANLLLDARGTLWVTDFGLAQIYADNGLTQPGDMLGTLRYMSPEQASGRAVVLDQRTDVYSLGVTLYELLTLEPAIPGRTREQLLNAITRDDARLPRSINAAIPSDIQTIVAKAMAKDPAERYPTARAMADDLWRFLQSEPILARPPSRWDKAAKWTRRHKSITVSALVILLVLAAGLLTSTLMIARAQHRAQAAFRQEHQRTAEATEQRAIAERQHILAETERVRADRNFQRAREVLDLFTEFATQDLAGKSDLADLRKGMLEASLAYYQEFIEDRKDDPSSSAALAQSRERATAILQDLTSYDDLFRVTTRSELLSQRDVRLELGLAPDGARDDGTAEFVPGSWRKLLGDRDLGRMAPAERRACLADVAARIEARLDELLTPAQLQRLRQIHRQVRGAAAFADPDIIDALSLTRDQKARIRALQTRSRGSGGGRGGNHAVASADESTLRDARALLTLDQVRKWQELIGPPFKRAPMLPARILKAHTGA
jgi:serine/threonine protein kinase